jgi:hypothetical protein
LFASRRRRTKAQGPRSQILPDTRVSTCPSQTQKGVLFFFAAWEQQLWPYYLISSASSPLPFGTARKEVPAGGHSSKTARSFKNVAAIKVSTHTGKSSLRNQWAITEFNRICVHLQTRTLTINFHGREYQKISVLFCMFLGVF